MFFQNIHQLITAGTDLNINIRRVENNLTVAVLPRRKELAEGKQETLVPLVLNATPQELDKAFFRAITAPIQKVQDILTNLEAFERQAAQATSQSKTTASAAPKEPKEVREKREKMERLIKRAEDTAAQKNYSDALIWLKQARNLAQPEKQKEIDGQIAAMQKKAAEGSLFGDMTTQTEAVQPAQAPAQQPVQPPQPTVFHTTPAQQPAQPPQPAVFHTAPAQQPVQSQQPVVFHTAPAPASPREYQAPAQENHSFNFDKEDEDDRALLREDPYAEYLDCPEEYRMENEAEVEIVYC